MLISKIKKLSNKEINNRLSSWVFPDFKTQTCHFTNGITYIYDYLIPYLVENVIIKDVLKSMSKEQKIDTELFNITFCQHSLLIIIGDN